MTPAARVAAAIDILAELQRGDAPTRDILVAYFRKRRYAGSRDRAAIRERVYDTVRDLALLKWRLAGAGGDPQRPRHWLIAACALAGEPVADLFDGAGYGPPALDAGETALAAALAVPSGSVPEAVRLGCPDWLEAPMRRALGTGFAAELAALNAPAPVDLRVNVARIDRAGARRLLAEDGIDCTETPVSPFGLRLAEHRDLADTRAMRDGFVEVQDEGSQMLALAAGAVPGERIVDYCAGAGGKTLALAAAMRGEGRIVACDVSMARLRCMVPRLERAGVAAMVELHDLSAGDGAPLPPGTADCVFVDAPCSASGTWRRHPFQRWRLDAAALDRLVALQREILDAACRLVRPGGRLVYATCSLLDEENAGQAARFAAGHPEFVRRRVDESLPDIVAADMVSSLGELRLTPARHGSDGVFAALFERKAA
jgi:16S rRNA (cytosine967-C5)-methyltransferase